VNREYFALLSSAFFIYSCNTVFMVAIPLLVIRLGGTEMMAGTQATLFLSVAVLLRFFFGPLADAYGRRVPLLLGSAVYLLTALGFFCVTEIWQVFALRLVQAIGLAAFFPAAIATAAAYGGTGRKGTFIGLLRLAASMSLMAGPVGALYLIDHHGYGPFFGSTAVAASIGMLAILCVSPREIGGATDRPPNDAGADFQRRLNFLPLLAKYPLILAITFAAAAGFGCFMSFAALFVKASGSVLNAGLFFTLFSVGGILANGTVGWLSDHAGRWRSTLCTVLCLGAGTILFALFPYQPTCFYPAGLLAGAGYYGSIVVLMAWTTDRVDPAQRTAALSLQQNALDAGIAVGSMVFGALQAYANDYALLFGGLGLLYLIVAILIGYCGKTSNTVSG
jgi:MFS family permease